MEETRTARLPIMQKFGPGLVFLLSALGAGDIVSNAAAGAQYRFSLAWVLLGALVFRFVWLDTSARYVLLTGQSLLQGFHRFGSWATWFVLGAVVLVRHGLNLSKILLLGEATQLLFPLPGSSGTAIWAVFWSLVAFAVVVWGGYRWIEKLFTGILVALGGMFVAAAYYHFPPVEALVAGLTVPSLPAGDGPFSTPIVILALIGTEAGSMTNLTYSYFVREKGWRTAEAMTRQRRELFGSISCMFLMGLLVQITAAGVFAQRGAAFRSTEELVQLLGETQGVFGSVVFALGLWAALFTGLVGATTGYGLIAVDAVRRLLFPGRSGEVARESREPKHDPLFRGLAALWILGPLYILWIPVEPLELLLLSHALAALMIPLLALGLLALVNGRSLRERFAYRWVVNAVLVLITGSSLAAAVAAAW
ncbi:MAG: Nramp family divalent metal transporter [Acidobacteriota bacterium]